MQCKSYFPGYYSTRDLNLEVNGSAFPFNNIDKILNNGHYCPGSLSSPSPDLHLGCNKEALKQTMLKHESIFRDQIHELHRLYRRQKELMEEVKRTELCKYHLQLETSQSNPLLSQSSFNNVLNTWQSSTLPWANPSCGQSHVSESKSSLLPLNFADGKKRQAGSYPSQRSAFKADSEFLVSEGKKYGKKILDLELPAYEYADSDEEKILEKEKVSDVSQILSYPLKRKFEIVHKRDKEPSSSIFFNSEFQQNNWTSGCTSLKAKCLVDLNEPVKAEEKANPSSSLGPLTGYKTMKSSDLSGIVDSDFQVLSTERNEIGDTRGDVENSSNVSHSEKNILLKIGVSDDDVAGKATIDLNSSPEGPCAEKSSLVQHVEVKQPHELIRSHVSNLIGKRSRNEDSQNFGDLCPRSHTGAAVTSFMSTSYRHIPHTDVPEMSSVSFIRKSNLEVTPIAVQALTSFNNSLSPRLDRNKFLDNSRLATGSNVDNTDSPQSRFCNGFQSDSKKVDVNRLSSNADDSASWYHNLSKSVKVPTDGNSSKEVNLDSVPISSSNLTVYQNIIDEGKEVGDLIRRLPCFIGKPVGISDKRSEQSTNVASVCKPCIPNCQCSSHASLLKQSQDLPGDKNYQNNRKDMLLDINLDFDPLVNSEEQLTTNELPAEKGLEKELCGFKVCIDLNSCGHGDESSPSHSHSGEIDLEAPASPENKESNRPRGELDENQASPENKKSSFPIRPADEKQAISEKKGNSSSTEEYGNNQSPANKDSSPPRERAHEKLSTPESKERSLRREESYESQSSLANKDSPSRVESDGHLEMPFWCSDNKNLEELVRGAAEAITAISSSGVRTTLEILNNEWVKSSPHGQLYWFAKVASSVVDDSESKYGLALSSKDGAVLEELPSDEIDYFEAMTLQLTEMTAEEYLCKSSIPEPEVTVLPSLPDKPRRGRTRRGRQQQKDFQNEVLPSLASLSRYEVTEDLQTIGGLMEAAGTRWETGSLRNAGRNVLARGRRRSCVSTSRVQESTSSSQRQQQAINPEVQMEERKLINWGKITRRRRGPRCPAGSNRRLILGEV